MKKLEKKSKESGKLNLEDLTVNSFVTALNQKDLNKVKGGKAQSPGGGGGGTGVNDSGLITICDVEAC